MKATYRRFPVAHDAVLVSSSLVYVAGARTLPTTTAARNKYVWQERVRYNNHCHTLLAQISVCGGSADATLNLCPHFNHKTSLRI